MQFQLNMPMKEQNKIPMPRFEVATGVHRGVPLYKGKE